MIDVEATSRKPVQVDVFIVNWNTADLLVACLASLMATDEVDDLNVVVVDNGSSDHSVKLVSDRFPEVSVVENNENAGFARAHNQAFDVSDAPYVLLLNSDAEVPSGTIAHCRDLLRDDDGIGVVGCAILHPDGSPQNSVFRFPSVRGLVSTSLMLAQAFPNSDTLNYDRYGSALPATLSDVEVVMGSFLMVRRDDLNGQLLDDGYFMYTEEADLCRRMSAQGFRTVFEPAVSITHVKGGSTRSPAQIAWSYEAKRRSALRYLRKWRGPLVAYGANLLLLVDLLPRTVGWLAADLRSLALRRQPSHYHKISILGFHLRALVTPSAVSDRFHGPPVSE